MKQSWQVTRAERREGTDVAMVTFGDGRLVKAVRRIVIMRRREERGAPQRWQRDGDSGSDNGDDDHTTNGSW